MKKIYIITVFAVLAAIMTACSESKSSNSLDYIAVKTSKDAKWGFIGPDGKMLYEEEFEKTPSPVINGFFTVEENDGISVYKADAKKPELVPGCEDLVDAGYMIDGVIPVTHKNERIKLVDASGKEKLTFMPVDGKEIIGVNRTIIDGTLCFMTADNKCGLINTDGKVLVPAKYDLLTYAGEGMVFVGTLTTPDSLGMTKVEYSLLNKDGKEITKFKDRMNLHSQFIDGKALVMKSDENIPGYIDKKGIFSKLPAKVHGFGEFFNGKEFAFITEDNKTGLMNLEGEILIRPKYESLGLYSEYKFYVKDGDKKWSILSKTGEKEKTFDDFEYFISMYSNNLNKTKFEVIAGEKDHQYDFYTFEGKSITQESFYALNFIVKSSLIYTDYFNAEEVGKRMASYVNDNGVNGVLFGTEISKLLPEGAKAMTYSNEYSLALPDISGGYKWTLKINAETADPIASPEYTTKTETYWFSTYSRQVLSGYKFNNAKVVAFSIVAESSKDFADDATKAIIEILKQHGFKQINIDDYEGESLAVLKKGKVGVNVNYYEESGTNTLILNVYQDLDIVALDEMPSDSVAVDSLAN